MSQHIPVIDDMVGAEYRAQSNQARQALMSNHKGGAAPSYAEAGMIWCDDSVTPWLLKLYDGADWITLGAVDASTDQFTPYVDGAVLTAATTSTAGLVTRASDSMALAGTVTNRFVSPAHVAAYVAEHAGGTGSYTLLATADADNSAMVDFTSDIDDTYHRYELHIINLVPTTNNVVPMLRFGSGTVPAFHAGATNYEYTTLYHRYGFSGPIASASNGANAISLTGAIENISNAAGTSFNSVIELHNPSHAGLYPATSIASTYQGASTAYLYRSATVGVYKTSILTISALRILMSAGNIASGAFKLYGVK